MPAKTFVDCTCPGCKTPLDAVTETTPACPACGAVWEKSAVWATRKYPGVVFLPAWVRAFGWPMLLIGGGVGFILWSYSASGRMNVYAPALMISVGLVFFFLKLSGADQ